MQIKEGTAAVVTGAAGGMGRSVALALADRGVRVVVADVDQNEADLVAQEIRDLGGDAIGQAVDVTDLAQVKNLAAVARERYGDTQILVNNAGVTLRPFRASWDTSYDDYRWVMEVNFWGVLHGYRAFVPAMLDAPGQKHIVNTSSMATTANSAGHSAYNVSKAAVDALSLTTRKEFEGRGIGVSILHPGAVRTRIVTSERLRAAAEQSANRGVKPWSDYVIRAVDPIADAKPAVGPVDTDDPDVPSEWSQYITPAATGWLVVRGIELDLPHILTHPWPEAAIDARASDLKHGLPDYSGWQTRNVRNQQPLKISQQLRDAHHP